MNQLVSFNREKEIFMNHTQRALKNRLKWIGFFAFNWLLYFSPLFGQVANYFPLKLNNYWNYGNYFWTIVDSVSIENNLYYELNDTSYFRFIRLDPLNQLTEYRNGIKRVWYKFSAAVGESWQMADSVNVDEFANSKMSLDSSGVMVKTKAGLFPGCLVFRNERAIPDFSYTIDWLAPGVGIVRRVEDSIIGPVVFELNDFYLTAIEKRSRLNRSQNINLINYGNYPNPFNNETVIHFELLKQSSINIKIYDNLGTEIFLSNLGELPGGHYQIKWQGENLSGTAVSSGLYFYLIEANQEKQCGKMLLLR